MKRIIITTLLLLVILGIIIFLGIAIGSSGSNLNELWQAFTGTMAMDPILATIIQKIRLPRVLLAAEVGAALSLGGLVFQALLRNPLAEPYILGISGGAALGAILGILLGFSRFIGVSITAFSGSMLTLFLILVLSAGKSIMQKDALLLSGVMVNAFCSSVIMFAISMTHDSRLHNILFWIMGDFSLAGNEQVLILFLLLLPCFILILGLTHKMNLLLMGQEMAMSMGVNVKTITLTLLVVTTFMVSATVCHSGLLGFVGLVMPHLLRLILGPDHRILAPACILAGSAYMVACDLLARWLPFLVSVQGEIPAGVITAMIGAPLFIFLLKKTSL